MSTYGALLFWLQRGPMSWIKRLWMMITKSIQSASNYQINAAPIRFINFMLAKTLKVYPDHIPRSTKKIHVWQIPAWSSSDQLWLDIPLMALWLDSVGDDDESWSGMARGRRIRSDQVNKTQHKVSRLHTLVFAHTSSTASITTSTFSIGTETHTKGICY